jgi:hypothetical protein
MKSEKAKKNRVFLKFILLLQNVCLYNVQTNGTRLRVITAGVFICEKKLNGALPCAGSQ